MQHTVGRGICFVFLLSAVVLVAARPRHAAGSQFPAQTSQAPESFQSLDDILRYITLDWDRLTRSMANCDSFVDSKTSGDLVLYLPAGVPDPPDLAETLKHCSVRIAHFPAEVQDLTKEQLNRITSHGLLYLENPYVVPGGQFNEMYGWDSYFIIRGLVRSNRRDLARGMVENFFYEIEHYGGVLNANRTYYLRRSQPPFLSSMILAVFRADEAAGQSNAHWLEKAYGFAVKDYEQWNRARHLAGGTGLARYFDEGEGPVPEIMGDPSDYYRGVAHYFVTRKGKDSPYLVWPSSQPASAQAAGPIFDLFLCDGGTHKVPEKDCAAADHVALTAEYYKGDRSMRESGFDVSFRFGPYGADTHHFAPVCLNSLLYKTETDLEEMSRILNRPDDARHWQQKARDRAEKINKYLWDQKRGLFFDYDLTTHSRSSYEYATTFYPLWAGFATKEQAAALAHNLALFEQPGGLAMSRRETEAQWDYPYGWAPIQLLAIEGLRRYGYEEDADRITLKFLSMILENFRRDHTIREKYDVVTRSSQTNIKAGYALNVTGFGWTNGVFLELWHKSPPQLIAQLRKD